MRSISHSRNQTKDIKKSQTPKYNTLTGIYYQPKIDKYKGQKIQELQELTHIFFLIKRNFHEKLKIMILSKSKH